MSVMNVWPISVENGRVHSSNQPTLTVVDDANQSKWMAQFADGADQRLHFCIPIPPNYISGELVRIRWRTPATNLDAMWRMAYLVRAHTEAFGSASASTGDVTQTSDGTANRWNEATISLSGLAAGKTLHCYIARRGDQGGDTLSAMAEMPEWSVEWLVDSTVAKGYRWIPPKAFTLPAGTGCTIGAPNAASDSATLIYPYAVAFPDAAGGFVDYSFALPSNVAGNVQTTLWVATGDSNFGVMKFSIAAAKLGVGDSIDPALTAQTPWSISVGAVNTLYRDLQRALVVSPSPNDTLILRITRDNTDSNNATVYMYGLLLEWDILTKNPSQLSLDPGSWALPPSDPMTITRWDGSNSSGIILQAADGADEAAHSIRMLSSLYVNGGTFKARWSSPAAGGDGYFRVDHSSPAVGASSDPAQTAGTPFASTTAGPDLMNELSVSIASGIAVSDIIETVLNRLGSDSLDTLGDIVRIHNAWIDVNN